MIEINSAMSQQQIIDLLESYQEGDLTFTFKEKKGIKLFFETNSSDLEEVCKIAKSTIKSQPWGSILYFNVVPAK